MWLSASPTLQEPGRIILGCRLMWMCTVRCKPYLVFMTIQTPSNPSLWPLSLHLKSPPHPDDLNRNPAAPRPCHAGHYPWTLYPLATVGLIPRERSAPSHVLTSETQSPPPTVLTLPSSWTWASKQRLGLLLSWHGWPYLPLRPPILWASGAREARKWGGRCCTPTKYKKDWGFGAGAGGETSVQSSWRSGSTAGPCQGRGDSSAEGTSQSET